MTILITNADACESLRRLIRSEMDRFAYMNDAYAASKSASGYTKSDISRQVGVVWGLKEAMVHVLQAADCATANGDPVAMVTISDVERRFPELTR